MCIVLEGLTGMSKTKVYSTKNIDKMPLVIKLFFPISITLMNRSYQSFVSKRVKNSKANYTKLCGFRKNHPTTPSLGFLSLKWRYYFSLAGLLQRSETM